MKTHQKIMLGVVGGSFALHLAAWAWVGVIKGERKHETIAIALADEKKKKKEDEKKKEPPKPPIDKKPEGAKVLEKKAPEPVVEKAAPPQDAKPASNIGSYADLGLGAMGGGTGGGGIPVGGGGGGGGGGPAPTATATQRHVALVPTGDCGDDLVKSKLEHQTQPAYTQEGRQANAEGAVQLELTLDATGHVVNVKVLHGLGYGLDEAAMAAARQWTFAPATKCGKPVPTTIKGKVRFTLS